MAIVIIIFIVLLIIGLVMRHYEKKATDISYAAKGYDIGTKFSMGKYLWGLPNTTKSVSETLATIQGGKLSIFASDLGVIKYLLSEIELYKIRHVNIEETGRSTKYYRLIIGWESDNLNINSVFQFDFRNNAIKAQNNIRNYYMLAKQV